MNYPIIPKSFRWDSLRTFVMCSLIAMIIAALCFIMQARAEEQEKIYLLQQQQVLSELEKWCKQLSISAEDTRLITAVILAHYATNAQPLFASSDIGFASWIKMMRYLHDKENSQETLLDYSILWLQNEGSFSKVYTNKWKDKVRIFLE